MSRFLKIAILSQLLISNIMSVAVPAQAHITSDTSSMIGDRARVPVYVWTKSTSRPKAMVLAIHGLSMHGSMYEAVGTHLAEQNILVAAPDLRGYGKWYENDQSSKAEYEDSLQDLEKIAQELRNTYPGVPLFLAGESLGGTVAVRLSAQNPNLFDGLILSAPALHHRHHVNVGTVKQLAMFAVNPVRKFDVSQHIENYFSDDKRIINEGLSDPLVRTKMSMGELYNSCRFMHGAADAVSEIPLDMPVLIMQGKRDRMVKASSVKFLEKKLRSSNRTVYWLDRGHILLETKHADAETLGKLSSWLENNCLMMRTAHTTASVPRQRH